MKIIDITNHDNSDVKNRVLNRVYFILFENQKICKPKLQCIISCQQNLPPLLPILNIHSDLLYINLSMWKSHGHKHGDMYNF